MVIGYSDSGQEGLRMYKCVWIVVVLMGCGPAAEPSDKDTTDRTTDDSDTDTDIADTDTSVIVDTGPDPCLEPPPPGPRDVVTVNIATEEDFDFDADGWLIYQGMGGIIAAKPGGLQEVVAPSIGGDPAGIQVLSNGNIVTLDRALGTLRRVVRATGVVRVIVSSLSAPNGIEIGENDRVYMTEPGSGRISWYDPVTDSTGAVSGQASWPNNLVLSNDEQKLFVASLQGIMEFGRTGDDTWNATPTRTIGEALGNILTVEIDQCDDLYTVSGNTMYRIFGDGSGYEAIANIPMGGFPSSIRWGNGAGSFERDTLYVTMRSVIHGVDVGRNGKRHPTAL